MQVIKWCPFDSNSESSKSSTGGLVDDLVDDLEIDSAPNSICMSSLYGKFLLRSVAERVSVIFGDCVALLSTEVRGKFGRTVSTFDSFNDR